MPTRWTCSHSVSGTSAVLQSPLIPPNQGHARGALPSRKSVKPMPGPSRSLPAATRHAHGIPVPLVCRRKPRASPSAGSPAGLGPMPWIPQQASCSGACPGSAPARRQRRTLPHTPAKRSQAALHTHCTVAVQRRAVEHAAAAPRTCRECDDGRLAHSRDEDCYGQASPGWQALSRSSSSGPV